MSETTKETRDALRAQVPVYHAKNARIEIRGDTLLAFVADADRLAELEGEVEILDRRAAERIAELEKRIAEFDELATQNAITRAWDTQKIEVQGRQIKELLAEVKRLTAIEAAAKRFVDMRNEWSKEAPDEVRLPMPLDYAGSALGAALYPDNTTCIHGRSGGEMCPHCMEGRQMTTTEIRSARVTGTVTEVTHDVVVVRLDPQDGRTFRLRFTHDTFDELPDLDDRVTCEVGLSGGAPSVTVVGVEPAVRELDGEPSGPELVRRWTERDPFCGP